MMAFNKKILLLILFVAVLGFMSRPGAGQEPGGEQAGAVTEETRQAAAAADDTQAAEKKQQKAQNDTPAKVIRAAEKTIRRDEAPAPKRPAEQQVRAKAQPAAADTPAQDQRYSELANSGGVLDMEEGIFKYARIPEKEIPDVAAESYIAPDQGTGGEFAETPDGRKGLFGLGPDATSYIAKGVLIFVIILIFIMYRLRSQSRDNKVLRRFP